MNGISDGDFLFLSYIQVKMLSLSDQVNDYKSREALIPWVAMRDGQEDWRLYDEYRAGVSPAELLE